MSDDIGDSAYESLEWMWGDAGSFPLLGPMLARANPMRWSRGTPEEVAMELGEGGKYGAEKRPVQLRVTGQSYTYQFCDPQAASEWIRESKQADAHLDESEAGVNFYAGTANVMATPALAVFCRHHSIAPWAQKNFFNAWAYAHRATNAPGEVSGYQSTPSEWHTRISMEWTRWDQSPDRLLGSFVTVASKQPPSAQNRHGVVTVGGEEWTLHEGVHQYDPFWAIYTSGTKVLQTRCPAPPPTSVAAVRVCVCVPLRRVPLRHQPMHPNPNPIHSLSSRSMVPCAGGKSRHGYIRGDGHNGGGEGIDGGPPPLEQ